MKKYKIKKRNVKLRTIVISLIILFILIILASILTNVKANEIVNYENYTIQSGDTLFTIANKLDLNEDLRETVYEIRKDNNISDCGNLKIGQVIKIKVK